MRFVYDFSLINYVGLILNNHFLEIFNFNSLDYGNSPMMNQNVDMGPSPPNVMYNMNMPYLDNSQRPNLSAFKQPIVQDFALQYGQQVNINLIFSNENL